jgi:hypothetical protein
MPEAGYYQPTITIQQVRDAKPEMIFYGVNTCWWTHDPKHLCTHRTAGLPCDPRGGMLMQTDEVEKFLAAAEENAAHYGRHGLRAFEAAHHLNMRVGIRDNRSTCFREWEEYNAAIDEFLLHTGKALDTYTVYENPKDHPGKFVARRWLVLPGIDEPVPQKEPIAVVDTIAEARAAVEKHKPGAVRLERHDFDDPCIVEVWL